MQQTTATSQLGLRQYTKDVPPGWRPRAYPIKEYKEYLAIWGRLTKLDQEQIGPAIMSRLEGGALRIALGLTIQRPDPNTLVQTTYEGVEAVSLDAQEAINDPQTGAQVSPPYPSGVKVLIAKLTELYYLDDQDLAWTSLDRFFCFVKPYDMDFSTYVVEWERLYSEAEKHGGLAIGDSGKAWLFFSRSGIPERQLADLRLKVGGDLTRYREMIALQMKISKNESASYDQSQGYKQYNTRTGEEEYDEDDWNYDEEYWNEEDDWYDYDSGREWTEEDYYDDQEDDDWQEDYPDDHGEDYGDYYGGKGKKYGGKSRRGKGYGEQPHGQSNKGKGKRPSGSQCTECGSKWHATEHCPMKTDSGPAGASVPEEGHHADNERPQDDEEYWNRKGPWKPSLRGSHGKGYNRRPQAPRYQPGRGKGQRSMGRSDFGRFSFKGKNKKGKGKRYSKNNYRRRGYGNYGQMYATFPTTSAPQGARHDHDSPSGFVPTSDSDGDYFKKKEKPKAGRAYQLMFGPDPPGTATTATTQTATSQASSSSGPSEIRHPPGLREPLYVPLSTTSLDAPRICHACWKASTSTCDMCQKQCCSDHSFLNSANSKILCFDCTASHIKEATDIEDVPKEGPSAASSPMLSRTPSSWMKIGSIPEATCEDDDDEEVKEVHLTGTPGEHGSFVAKGMIFHSDRYHNFTVIRGHKTYGLLIDPGASRGLIGTDTLADIITHILRPRRLEKFVKWNPSNNKFTGITADPQKSLSLVCFPIGLRGIKNATFTADVLGGISSKCPGLIPLVSLLNAGCIICCGYFANNDGLLGIRTTDGSICAQRLLLTDSGHYLLPIDQFNKPRDWKQDRLVKNEKQQLGRAAQRQLPPSNTTDFYSYQQYSQNVHVPTALVAGLYTEQDDEDTAQKPSLFQ